MNVLNNFYIYYKMPDPATKGVIKVCGDKIVFDIREKTKEIMLSGGSGYYLYNGKRYKKTHIHNKKKCIFVKKENRYIPVSSKCVKKGGADGNTANDANTCNVFSKHIPVPLLEKVALHAQDDHGDYATAFKLFVALHMKDKMASTIQNLIEKIIGDKTLTVTAHVHPIQKNKEIDIRTYVINTKGSYWENKNKKEDISDINSAIEHIKKYVKTFEGWYLSCQVGDNSNPKYEKFSLKKYLDPTSDSSMNVAQEMFAIVADALLYANLNPKSVFFKKYIQEKGKLGHAFMKKIEGRLGQKVEAYVQYMNEMYDDTSNESQEMQDDYNYCMEQLDDMTVSNFTESIIDAIKYYNKGEYVKAAESLTSIVECIESEDVAVWHEILMANSYPEPSEVPNPQGWHQV